MICAGRALAAAMACALVLPSPGAHAAARDERAATAVEPEGDPAGRAAADAPASDGRRQGKGGAAHQGGEALLRRAVEALARPGAPLPGDPCRVTPTADGPPCFPASVERQGLTPEQKLARFFQDFDALHGPTFASAPTVSELWQLPASRGIPLDFLPLVKLLLEARRRHQPPRYFLYTARDGARAWPLLRDGRLPAEVAYARPGVTYEELGGFPDRKTAQAAYERLEDALAAAASRGAVRP